jgi:hypothetical protein
MALVPELGNDVIYTRGAFEGQSPEEYAAKISRVIVRDAAPEMAKSVESDYDVWLVVFVHNPPHREETWYTPQPVKYDGEGRSNTWRWPNT